MRKLFISAIIILLTGIAAIAASAGKDMFAPLSSERGIESVFVGKALLSQAVKESSDSLANEALKQVDYIVIYSATNRKSANIIGSRGMKIAEESGMDLQMSTNEDGVNIRVYSRPYPGDDNYFSQLVMIMKQEREATIINIGGKLDLSSLDNIKL